MATPNKINTQNMQISFDKDTQINIWWLKRVNSLRLMINDVIKES